MINTHLFVFIIISIILYTARANPPANVKMRTMCLPIPARNDTQIVPSANIFVRTYGTYRRGQTVFVFLHGTSASSNYVRCVQEDLSSDYYSIAIDLRGHGQSTKTPATVPSTGFKYTYNLFSDDVYSVLQRMDIQSNVVVVGISIGASIAVQLSLDHPEVVDRIVLISYTPQFRCSDGSICNNIVSQIGSTPFTMFPEDTLSGCNVTNARAKLQQNRGVSTVAVTSLLEYSQKVNQTSLLPLVKVPTLLIHGTGDATLPGGVGALLAKDLIQNSILSYVVNRGHLSPVTAYKDIAILLTKFVEHRVFPDVSRVLDTGCQICRHTIPEDNFVSC